MKLSSACKAPGALIMGLAGTLAQAAPNAYVVNVLQQPPTITVFDTQTNLPVGAPIVIPATNTLGPDTGPQDIVINQAGTRAYIADVRANEIDVLDLSTANSANPVFNTIPLGPGGPGGGSPTTGPAKLAFRPGFPNQLFVVQFSGHVVVVDTDANGGAGAVIANSSLTLGSGSQSIVFNAAGTRAYIPNRGDNTVSAIRTETVPPTLIGSNIPAGPQPDDVAFDSARNRLLVANTDDPPVTAPGQSIRVFNIAANDVVTEAAPIATSFRPGSILLNPDNTRFYVVEDFGNRVFAFDAATLSSTPVDTFTVGTAPEFMEFSADGSRLYIPNAGSDNVSVFDTSGPTAVAAVNNPIPAGNNPKYLAIAPSTTGSASALQFDPSAVTVAENVAGGVVTLTVTRTGGTAGAISATVSVASGSATANSDFTPTATPATVSFASGDPAAKTVAVPITNDGASGEGNENFTVTLGAPTGGAAPGAGTATVTIADDDAAPAPPPGPPPAPAPGGDGGGGGGCALNIDGTADYGLPLLLLLAGSFYAFRRRVGK